MSLAERRGLRLFTFCLLFFAQGVPWGFATTAVPARLADLFKAHDLSDVAITAATGSIVLMATLPYAFKFVWGPVMDAITFRRLGRRRPWIVLAQAMMAVTVAAMLAIDDLATSFDLLLVLLLVHSIFNAMQNVAVEALAVELLDPAERGKANGLMYGAKCLGGIVGGAGMAVVIKLSSFRAAIALQAIGLLAITLVPMLVRERTGPLPPRTPLGVLVRMIGRVGRLWSVRLTALATFCSYISIGIVGTALPGLIIGDIKRSQSEYDAVVGGLVPLATAAGAALGGLLADKVGQRRLAVIASATIALLWLGFALGYAWRVERYFMYSFLTFEAFTGGAMTAALYTLCMSTSLPRTAATQYAIYVSLMSLGMTFGVKLSSHAIATWSYRGTYVVAAILQIASIAILPFIDPDQARRELLESTIANFADPPPIHV